MAQSTRRRYLMVGVAALILLPMLMSNLVAQTDDEAQILRLLGGLSNHSVKPSEVLDPSLDPEKRESSLGHFEDSYYELELVPVGPLRVTADGVAKMPVRVHFKNAHSEVSAESTAEFVKRNQVWYFANFSFVGFPVFLIVVLIVGIVVGVSYVSGVLFVRWKLHREGRLDWGNRLRILVPIFWPGLLHKDTASGTQISRT